MAFFLTAAAVLILDQVTKALVIKYMQPSQSIPVIENFFHLTYVRNPGAAFGILAYRTGFFVLASLLIGTLIVLFYRSLPASNRLTKTALPLQFGGAVGNLVDRLRFNGYVVDFLDFSVYPAVFNVADIAIVVGIGLILIDILRAPGVKEE